jgi:ABC-type xylose transport system permease subunit
MLQTSVTGIIAVGMLMVIVAGRLIYRSVQFSDLRARLPPSLTSWELGLPAALLTAIIIGSLSVWRRAI